MPATPHFQSSAPTFSLATLREVLAAMEAAHPGRAARLVHAANLVAVRRIQLGESGRVWWVQSECDATQEYMVVPVPEFGIMTCTCQDFQRRGGPCKHALAVQMLQACEAREHEPPPPIPFPTCLTDVDVPIPYEFTPLGLAALNASSDA
jgi:hypothetical protein